MGGGGGGGGRQALRVHADAHASISHGCYGILTFFLFFAGLFFLLEPRHTYLRA